MKKINFKTILLLVVLFALGVNHTSAQTLGSLSFNGIDNYVEVPISPLNTIDDGDFTIEAWIQGNDALQNNSFPMIFSNRGENDFGGGVLIFLHDQWNGSPYKMLCFQVNGDNYLILNNGTYNGSVLDGECHHVAISRNEGLVTFFIDGNEIGTKNIPVSSTVSFDGPLLIGKDIATNNTFNGLISQCRIWNVARTQSELDETKDVSLEGDEMGLLAYWEFDNGDGQIATDKTGVYSGVLGGSLESESQDPEWFDFGCVEESLSTENAEELSIQVSPNPTSGIITIRHQLSKNVKINVTTATGELILEKAPNDSNLIIDLSAYPNGTYFLNVQDDNRVFVRKIIKS